MKIRGGCSAAAMMPIILALFVALVLPNGRGVLAQEDNGDGAEEFDMFDALPGCLTEESYFETFRCVVEGVAPDCFEDNSVSTIRECFEDELNITDLEASDLTGTKEQLEDAAEECFAPYISCFNETLNAAIDAINSLHPCINETMTNLMVCGYENHETCAAACANAEVNDTAFDDVNYLDLLTCDGVQSNIMDEVCTTASCCPECVPDIELWAECVVNNVLDYMDEDCDFTCSGGEESSARKLKAAASAAAAAMAAANKNNNKNKRELQGGQGGGGGGGGEMPDAIDLPGAVRECMALIPGIHGGTNETELASRASFFECALEAFVEVIEDAADGDVLLGPGGPPGRGGGGGGGGGSAGGGRDPPGDGPGDGPDGDGTSENGEGKDKGPDGDGEGGGFGVSNTNATDDNGGDTSGAAGFANNNNNRAAAAAALVATVAAVAVAGLFF